MAIWTPMVRWISQVIRTKISGGVLSLSLGIAILSAAISMAIIILVYYHRLYKISTDRDLRLLGNLRSGIEYSLAYADEYIDKEGERSFQASEHELVQIEYGHWGMFQTISVQSSRGERHLSKRFIPGYSLDQFGRSAIYLMDDNRPLSLAGKTDIYGDSYFPKSGVRTAYVNRTGFLNKEYLGSGKILKSKSKLPELPKKRLQQVGKLIQNKWLTGVIDYESLDGLPGNLSVSFSAGLIPGYHSFSPIEIRGSYSGRLIIKSDSSIVVHPEASLSDIMLIAPDILFKSGFNGAVQALASDSIIVEGGAKINYPSALVMIPKNEDKSYLWIKDNAEVHGLILVTGHQDFYHNRVIKLEDKASFAGVVYCDGMLESYGDVKGHVSVRKFLVTTFTTIYENFLFNASFNADKLDTAYLVPPLFFSSGTTLRYHQMAEIKSKRLLLGYRVSGSTMMEVVVASTISSVVMLVSAMIFLNVYASISSNAKLSIETQMDQIMQETLKNGNTKEESIDTRLGVISKSVEEKRDGLYLIRLEMVDSLGNTMYSSQSYLHKFEAKETDEDEKK